jgi:Rrf2 family protein
MLKFNRTTEYGLIALRHLSQRQAGDASSAREIADLYGLPFDILAKTLQRLKESGMILSAQGARGGYMLQRQLDQVTLAEFLELMEGANGVVACAETPAHKTACEFQSKCQIHGMMRGLNARLKTFLSGIRLSEFTTEAASSEPIQLENVSRQVNS